MSNGKLYLIATPIGNLGDITLRAIETLKMVDLIAAEDTRHTLQLLNHLEISKPLISYHRHNEEVKSEKIIEELKLGNNIGLVTDAGTPGISDPGEEIVKECIKNNIEIIPIPGACAAINALIISGLNTKEFSFFGFLPLNNKLRKEKLERIKNENKTVIIYEAPHRIINTLEEIDKVFNNINIVVAKELTKIHETVYRGNCKKVIEEIGTPKGEFIIILDTVGLENVEKGIQDLNIEDQFDYYKKLGFDKKEIIKKIAKNKKVGKNEIYQLFIDK